MTTVVCFHAHPDDEVLLTGGTIARWHDRGHRVVLVVATDGESGLTAATIDASTLADIRRRELHAAAAILGVDRVVFLGYPDSGWQTGSAPAEDTFAAIPVESAGARLAEILTAENADALTVYDPAGGYGHPDHVQVHHVGCAAADLAGTPIVLEATVDRRPLLRALGLIQWLPGLPAGFSRPALARAYADPQRLTHRVDVGPYVAQKRAAMAAHVSQQLGPADRMLAWCLRLPRPLFDRVFRYEWFVQRGTVTESVFREDPLDHPG